MARLFRAELISQLCRFREMTVVDLASGAAAADYLLSFEVAAVGDRPLAIAGFTRASDRRVLWSESFQVDAASWWERQAEIAGRIASACNIHFSRTRLAEIAALGRAPDAVDAWLMGQSRALDFREDGWRQAEAHYRAAIAADPSFSLPYSSLSQLMNIEHLARPGLIRQPARHREAKALANQAIELDPWEARGHLHRAWASTLLHEFDQGDAGFAMAQRCNPNDPWTTISCALGFAFSDDGDQAMALTQRMQEFGWTTTPVQWGYHATIAFVLGDPERCLAAADNAGDAILNLPAWRAAALWELGREEEAAQSWSRFVDAARAHWGLAEQATDEAARDWLLSCFPIKSATARERLAAGANGAAALATSR
jgi:tetratricopeptide (TPR) repeat protein